MQREKYIAPEVTQMTPSPAQQEMIDKAVALIRAGGDAHWSVGRGAGKSTLRAMIAQAILDDGANDAASNDHPLYEVRPIIWRR